MKAKVALCAGLALAVLGGMGYGLASRGRAGPEPRPVAARPSGVAALGYVEGARPEVELRPEVSGVVASLPAPRGTRVKKGAVVLELANRSQKAQVKLREVEVRLARVKLQEAEADWKRAQRSGPGTSWQQKDKEKFAKQAAQEQLSQALAQLEAAEAELAKTRVVAPYDCDVLEINVEPGQQVGPESKPVPVIVADLSRRRVLAYVDEVDAERVAVGQGAEVVVDGLPGKVFAGKVGEVKPRMGRRELHSDAPDEYRDVWSRGVYVDLEPGCTLAPNRRVKVRIQVP